jgi:predicted nucleotidyltransferase
MQAPQEKPIVKEAILKTLQYFHYFKHPLYPEEIFRFLGTDISIKALLSLLGEMVADGMIYTHRNYYMLQDDETLVGRREEGAWRAQQLMTKAYNSARLIARFPFVKSVCISGSLSKGYANEKSDIDLFIITDEKRLWICRTFLHLFKKFTFVLGREHSFCMNYFIDESRLHIEEQNIFTATELATLLPVYNKATHGELISANKCWLVKTFPNACWDDETPCITEDHNSFMRSIAEGLLNVLMPRQVNLLLMKLTDSWWRYKWNRRNYPMHEYDLAMKTKWYVSKNHPLNYQKKVLKEMKFQPAQLTPAT